MNINEDKCRAAIDNVKRLSKSIKSSEDVKKAISAYDKALAKEETQNKFKKILEDLKLLGNMVKDASTGKFKLSFSTLAILTTALIYVISPIDLIPDYIPVVGIIDDAAVISWVFHAFANEIENYKKMKEKKDSKMKITESKDIPVISSIKEFLDICKDKNLEVEKKKAIKLGKVVNARIANKDEQIMSREGKELAKKGSLIVDDGDNTFYAVQPEDIKKFYEIDKNGNSVTGDNTKWKKIGKTVEYYETPFDVDIKVNWQKEPLHATKEYKLVCNDKEGKDISPVAPEVFKDKSLWNPLNESKNFMKSPFDSTIAYWDKILESYGKSSINQKKPESTDKIQTDDTQIEELTDFDDAERNPYGVFSPDLMNSGMQNGFANTWFITYPDWQYKENATFPREDLKEYSKAEFLDSCTDHVLAEVHDVVYDTVTLVGPMFYIDNIANWARGYYNGNGGETYASFIPALNKSIITLASISYGSYDGAAWPLDFTSKAAQQSLLDDIYEMMPYLQAFETSDAKKISFKLPREMMTEIYDNYMRRPYKWQWSSDMQHKKEVKQSQEDKMWADRNIHLSNKAQEIDQAWKAHDKKEI